LGVICLIPPLSAATFKDIDIAQFWLKLPLLESVYSLALLLWVLAYLLLYLMVKDSKDAETRPMHKTISNGAGRRSLFFFLLFLYHLIEVNMKSMPYIPILLVMLVYVLISFNQDKLRGVLQRR